MRDSVHRDGAGSPDLAPVVVRMTAGTPVRIPAKLRLPPVSLLTSWSRWFAVGRRSATPTLVAARVRIVRWNALASSNDRPGMVPFLPKLKTRRRVFVASPQSRVRAG